MLIMLINLRITVTEQSIFRVGVVIKLCSLDCFLPLACNSHDSDGNTRHVQ